MGDAIGSVLPLAVGVAISPLPVMAVILILFTPKARSNGPAFVAGWVLGLAVAATVTLIIAGPQDFTADVAHEGRCRCSTSCSARCWSCSVRGDGGPVPHPGSSPLPRGG